MTPDELEALILESRDSEPLAAAFGELDEKARAKLSSTARQLHKQLYRGKADQSASVRLKALLARPGDVWRYWNAKETCRAALALFALCPISAVKKREVRVAHQEVRTFDRIIRDRRPDWLDDWIAHDLDQALGMGQLDFRLLRGWIRDGVCRKPDVDGYYRMFAWFLMRTRSYQGNEVVPPISTQLMDEPDQLKDIDGLFRVESVAFNTNSWLRKGAAPDYETWPEALVKLSDQGHLDREHVLDLALDGLTLDLKQNQLSGFHGLYKQMAPDAGQLLRHQQGYIDLLCHPVGHVVKFAIDMLTEVEKAGSLDIGAVLREIQTVFLSDGKGNAIAALKLINRIIVRQGPNERDALGAVCEALRHAHTDVQGFALDILDAHTGCLDEPRLDALRGVEAFVAASNRPRLSKLLESATVRPSPSGRDEAPTEVSLTEAEAREPHEPLTYQAISDDLSDHTVLSSDDKIAPIGTVDALIDAILHAIEVVNSPDDVERIIDGVSRLAHDHPADLPARVAPLLHRLKTARGGNNSLIANFVGVSLALLDLIYTWSTGRLHRTMRHNSQSDVLEDAFVPVTTHLRQIAERVARKQSRSLLSAPTHKGGWIDPLVWVERLGSLQDDPRLAESMDFRLSLLRLAPDNRDAALARAASLSLPLRRIVSFALGGCERPARADRANHAVWISAARCRAPLKDWSAEFAPLELDDAWPDSLKPALYVWRSSYKQEQHQQLSWRTPELTVSVACDAAQVSRERKGGVLGRIAQDLRGRNATDWSALPTAALSHRMEAKRYWSGELNTAWVTQWLAYVWPQNVAASHIKGAVRLIQRMDENSSSWTPGFGYFQALFQRNRPWREPGHLLLCLGLVGKDADSRGLAVDALIEGIDGSRFDPDLFASTFTSLAEGEWIKFNRLGEALMPVIQVSRRHAWVVSEALQKCLPRLDLQQKNAFHVLKVLVEGQALIRQPLGQDARDALSRVAGSGKAAKMARRLLGA